MEGEVTQVATENATPTAVQADPTGDASRGTPQETVTENDANGSNGKPEGFEPVEFTPEQKKRVDRLYGNMKRYEAQFREQVELNQRLVGEFQKFQEDQSRIVAHLQNADYQKAETEIKAQKREALQKGDMDTYDALNDRLIEINVAKKTADKPKSKTQEEFIYGKGAISGSDVIERAVQQGAVTQDEADIYRSWQSETDEAGNIKRPWANSGDVRNSAAAIEGRAVFSNPAFQNKSFAEKLREIDRRMGIANQSQPKNPSVLPPGNLTRGNQNSKVAVSDYEARVAIRTKFGGPKAKSDADHVEAWKQAKIKSQSKGSRK